MAKRSLGSMLKTLMYGEAAALKEEKLRSIMDDPTMQTVDRILKPLLEADRKRYQEELRAYQRKNWLKVIAAYGSVGYVLTSAVQSFTKTKN